MEGSKINTYSTLKRTPSVMPGRGQLEHDARRELVLAEFLGE